MLTITHLHKSYTHQGQTIPAVQNLSFSVQPEQFVSLVGPSGCGKSTLFRLLAGLEQPDSGQILLHQQPLAQRTGLFGYMPQRDLLLPWRTVLDNAILGLELAGHPRPGARLEAQEWLPLFGLERFAQAYPYTLSGGMKQRVALLRTFLCHKEVMLLDEPFGALDALTRRELQQWLLRIQGQFHKTILFITHDVEEALFLADRVLVFSPRPGKLLLDLPIHLPHPRGEAIRLTPAFTQLKKEVLQALGY